MNELKVGDVNLRNIIKSLDEDEPTVWFAQVILKFFVFNREQFHRSTFTCIQILLLVYCILLSGTRCQYFRSTYQLTLSILSTLNFQSNALKQTYSLVQDAKGGIWKLDLSFSHTSMAPERLMSYTAGAILACSRSPVAHLVATGGADSKFHV